MNIEFSLKRIGLFGVVIVLGLYLVICLGLYFAQERLLFFPRGISEDMKRQNSGEAVEIVSSDVTLRGWHTFPERKNLIIYYGGNGEELSYLVQGFQSYEDFSALLVNYRGYGESDGKPSEKALFEDALNIYDQYAGSYEKVFLVGRSLGSGVACYVASERKVDALALVTPYDSITCTAQEKFPILPMGLLVRHSFDSIGRAPRIQSPALFVVAGKDEIISEQRSSNLFDAWGGEKTWLLKKLERHNSYSLSLSGAGDVYQYFRDFLKRE